MRLMPNTPMVGGFSPRRCAVATMASAAAITSSGERRASAVATDSCKVAWTIFRPWAVSIMKAARRAGEVGDKAGQPLKGMPAVDRCLGMRAADDGVGLALADEAHRGLDVADGRFAGARIERLARSRPDRALSVDEGRGGVEAEAVGGVLDHEAVADQQRLDLRPRREVLRRLDRDLRPDAVGVAEGDRDLR